MIYNNRCYKEAIYWRLFQR